jgi:hypothetical protein
VKVSRKENNCVPQCVPPPLSPVTLSVIPTLILTRPVSRPPQSPVLSLNRSLPPSTHVTRMTDNGACKHNQAILEKVRGSIPIPNYGSGQVEPESPCWACHSPLVALLSVAPSVSHTSPIPPTWLTCSLVSLQGGRKQSSQVPTPAHPHLILTTPTLT